MSQQQSPMLDAVASAQTDPPTRARYFVLLLGFLVSLITYLDRVCISAAAPAISLDLRLSSMQMGYVFSAFALSYAIFELPSGWWGDRIGQRRVLTRVVAGWSVFTMLTGLARSYPALLVTRFVFGGLETGAFPTLSRALARWSPTSERARANGVMWMGARLGGAIAPPLAAVLIAAIGWRATFAVFGCVGFFWCLVFWNWFRDDPAQHPSVNAAELAIIRGGSEAKPGSAEHGIQEPDATRPPAISSKSSSTPWRRIFSSGTLWAMFGMYFCSAYGFWFFVTWLPTFLVREHGLSLKKSGLYASLPLAAGTIACLAGGAFSDWLVKRTGNVKWSRRAIGVSAFVLAAAGFGCAAKVHSPLLAVLLLAAAEGSHDMSLPVSWATVTDVGGRFGGTASAFMNMASSLSAMVSSVSAAWLASKFGSFDAVLAVASAVYFIGGMLWLSIDPTKSISD